MAFTIYKHGQGYWTRVLSAVGAAILVFALTAWLWDELAVIKIAQNRMYAQISMAVLVFGGFGLGLFWAMNKPNVVDFYIATDAEMRKVNWPTRREILGSTWVVICGTLIMGLLLWIVDIGFAWLFQRVGVLESAG